MNPFKDLYAAGNRGVEELPDFPLMMDLEVTNACNFRCLMCPTGNLSMTRPTSFMSDAVWKKIVRQAKRNKTALRFIGWGEPTLHRRLVRWVGEASSYGLLTHLNTNGSKLTPDALVAAGLKSVKFSFQGDDRESYAEMRGKDFFTGLIAAVRGMHKARGGRPTPYISASTTVLQGTMERTLGFQAQLEPFADEVGVGRTIWDFMDLDKARLRPDRLVELRRLSNEDKTVRRHPDPCPEVWTKLSISHTGDVRVCCNDYNGSTFLGNVMDKPLAEIWRDATIEYYRERLSAGCYDQPLCRHCWDYMELSP